MADQFEMVCERCSGKHTFDLEGMRAEINKTIARMGIMAILARGEVEWLCDTCAQTTRKGGVH